MGILGLGAQYAALLGGTVGVVEGTCRFLCYFTYWTNAIAALSMLLPVWLPDNMLGRFLSRPAIRAVIAANLAIAGIVYHFALREPFELTWSSQADFILHYVTPVLYLADWLLSVPRTRLPWHTATFSISVPIAYGVWMFGYGAITHWYPYPFIELPTLGIAETLLNLFCLLSVFVVATALLVLVDRAHLRERAMTAAKAWVAMMATPKMIRAEVDGSPAAHPLYRRSRRLDLGATLRRYPHPTR
jgi:hypothetical protein